MSKSYPRNIYLLALFFSINHPAAFAQGCSDAGFCSIVNHSKPSKTDSTVYKCELKVGIGYGMGEGQTNIITPSVALKIRLEKNIYWSNKINAQAIIGRLGKNIGGGDIFSTITFDPAIKNLKHRVTLIAGFKIPLNISDNTYKGASLPMTYQSSLGTIDFIGGINYSFKNLYFQAAAQIPLVQFNQNSYVRTAGIDSAFATTTVFIRKPDVLLRVGYIFQILKKKWIINPNLLAIYHLQKDTYLDSLKTRLPIAGSDGFTLNANLLTSYQFTQQHGLELSVGVPLIVRKTRPDGLTRVFAVGIEYKYNF